MKTLTTTSHSTRLLGSCAALVGSVVIAATPASADDKAKFEAADIDTSGTLTLAEFKTALPAHTPEKQLLKKFQRADANIDLAVTLDEWLAYRADLEQEVTDREKHTAIFESADIDNDDFLSFDEFIPTVPGKKPLIEVRKRFLRVDTDADVLISLDEWLAMKDGKMLDPVKHLKFDLADRNGDGELTSDEFATTFPRKTPARTVLKKFNREDANDDGVLTRDEWNPGGKKKSDPA